MSNTFVRFVFFCASIALAHLNAQPISLGFEPVAVQYSKSLDRLIMISANPNKVHVVNPVTSAETSINLSLIPLSLSVSPDGTHAAVGHDGWISYVNLSAGYVEKNLAVTLTAKQVVLSGSGIVWVPSQASVNIATGVQTASNGSIYGASFSAVHPNGTWIYNTDDGSSPDILAKGDVSSGAYQFLYTYPYWGDFPSCGGIFYSADGNRMLTGCGTFFRTTASKSDDMTYNGSLSAASQVTSGVDSAITQKFVVIPGNSPYYTPTTTDTEIQFYDDNYLTLLGRVALPNYVSGSITAPWHGRNVYYSPDASKLYLILQADPKANLTNDYAIEALTLSTGSACNPSLGASSSNVPAAGGSVSVNVTATSGCLWQASSNATWISIGAGGISDGNGTVTILAAPNLQTSSRSGTLTIAGISYTVTQDAAASLGVNPVTASPARPVAADYSAALDRMILVSTNPNLLTILDPVSGTGQTVLLNMPPTALSISPDGQHAAVGHDGRISYVNLATATLENTFAVTETVFNLALSSANIYAFPLHDQWRSVRIINLATGAETLWNEIYAGSTGGRISPNGKYLYVNASKRYDISQPLASAFDAIIGNNPLQWFSQDGSRLFSGNGQAFRLSDIASQDLQYNGTLATNGLAAVADSSVQQVTATVNSGSSNDLTINFFAQQYLASIGSISIPGFTVGANTYKGHGRYLFWNAAGNRLFALIQADPASGLLNDYAIYTVSLNGGGCGTSLNNPTASILAAGGTFTATVTATAGCAWKATSGASWVTISGNAFSAGPATVTYIVDANPTTAVRSATITSDGTTLTITQAAGTQVQLSSLAGLPFRAADADYSKALDRIVALSGSPDRLNIYDPVTGSNTPVTLPLPGNAMAVAPSGIRAAVCHDGLVSIVNLQTATIEKSLSVSVNCHDIAYADNGYVYMSVTGGWGSSDSLNTATGAETHLDLYYNGTNFRLNATGDAVYTSNTGTSGESVTRYGISTGPLTLAYSSDVYPAHPAGYTVWFTADGRMIGDSGSVFQTGSTLATDFLYTGTLSGYSSNPGTIATVAHSPARHLFASVGTSTDDTLYLHGDKYLVLSSRLTFPNITMGGVSAKSHGKFVFWDSTGTKAYVILQADSSAGFLNDYAVYTLSPGFTASCAVTLGTNSGTAIGYADTGSIAVNAASDCVWQVTSNTAWIQVDSGTLGVGQGNVSFSVLANGTTSPRTGTITVGGQTFTLTQAGGSATVAANLSSSPPGESITVSGGAGCPVGTYTQAVNLIWAVGSTCSVGFGDPASYAGSPYAFRYSYVTSTASNSFALSHTNPLVVTAGTSPLSIYGSYAAIPGPNPGAVNHLSVSGPATAIAGSPVTFTVTALDGNNLVVTNYADTVHFTSADPVATLPADTTLTNGVGTFSASLVTLGSQTVGATDLLVGSITGTRSITVSAPPGLRYVPVTPCRVADTRNAAGPFGGPLITGGTSRDFVIPSSVCGIPSTAQAYSLNVAVAPTASLGYLTLWPAGQTRPVAATLNSLDGRIKSNAAIVPAGTGGALSLFAADSTHVILDINGYFVPATDPTALAFYPMTPCRLVDTRNGTLLSGPFSAGTSRTLPIQSGNCNVPATAQAYSLNFVAVPSGPLGYLTAYPTGLTRPQVATLNAPTGTITANATIVPAGAGGSIDVYASNTTQLVMDIDGYFAPAGAGGLSLYTVPPCRVLDTRHPLDGIPNGVSGQLDVDVLGAGCGGTPAAKAYVFNATAVPPVSLGFLTLWPQGSARAGVATLNALDAAITNNMAIVPTTNTQISAFASDPTQLILDLSGYFAP